MSTKFEKLEEDDIKIEVINNNINIILRNLNNENINYALDTTKITQTSQLRSDVKKINTDYE